MLPTKENKNFENVIHVLVIVFYLINLVPHISLGFWAWNYCTIFYAIFFVGLRAFSYKYLYLMN
jgi:uncharacterized membrane protein